MVGGRGRGRRVRRAAWPPLAGLPHWDDRGRHPATGGEVWFYKRAQLAAADLALAGLARFADLDRLTLMADNLVPHVLRLDGVLRVEPGLVERIERGELLTAGEPEEVELRAVAVTAGRTPGGGWPTGPI